MRICTRCGLEKPLTEFYKGTYYKDGYCQYCKECSRELRRNSWNHVSNKRRPSVKNSGVVTTTSTRKRNNSRFVDDTIWCPKCESYKNKEEFYKLSSGKYFAWCIDCEKKSQAKRRTSVEYKVLRARIDHERRNNQSLTENSLSESDVIFLYEFQNGQCARCKREFSQNLSYEIDHILPVSKGGDLILSNTQLLCKSCNCSKKDKTVQYRATIHI